MSSRKNRGRKPAVLKTAAQIAAESHNGVTKFVAGLAKSLKDIPNHVCSWSEDGSEFIIADRKEFVTQYKKGTHFNSFIRQLHYYGFQKLKKKGMTWRFRHEYFHRDKPEDFHKVIRLGTREKFKKTKSTTGANPDALDAALNAKNQEISRLQEDKNKLNKEAGKLKRKICRLEKENRSLKRSRDTFCDQVKKERAAKSSLEEASKRQKTDVLESTSDASKDKDRKSAFSNALQTPQTAVRRPMNSLDLFEGDATSQFSEAAQKSFLSRSNSLAEDSLLNSQLFRANSFSSEMQGLERGLIRHDSFRDMFGFVEAPPAHALQRQSSITSDGLRRAATEAASEFMAVPDGIPEETVENVVTQLSKKKSVGKSEVSDMLTPEQLADLVLNSPTIDSKAFVKSIVEKYSGIQEIPVAEESHGDAEE